MGKKVDPKLALSVHSVSCTVIYLESPLLIVEHSSLQAQCMTFILLSENWEGKLYHVVLVFMCNLDDPKSLLRHSRRDWDQREIFKTIDAEWAT